MTFHMNVRVDRVHEEGSYRAILDHVEPKETRFGERLMWTFRLPEENAEVVGFTSMSPSTKANAYQWAGAIMVERHDGYFKALCPGHPDQNTPSLSVTQKEDGAVLIHCFVCKDQE